MTAMPPNERQPLLELDPAVVQRRTRMRKFKDAFAKHAIGVGGISVIGAIVLIFIYLLSVVFPLFLPPSMERVTDYPAPGEGQTLLLAMEEQREIGLRMTDDGVAHFFNLADGSKVDRIELALPAGAEISSFTEVDEVRGWYALGLTDGTALVVRHHYRVTFPDGGRKITPRISYPLGEEPIELDPAGEPIRELAIGDNEENVTLLARLASDELVLQSFLKEESFTDDGVMLELDEEGVVEVDFDPVKLLVDGEQRRAWLIGEDGRVALVDISDKAEPEVLHLVHAVQEGRQLAGADFLLGDVSLLVTDDAGVIGQWFPLRNAEGEQLVRVREFELPAGGAARLAIEQRRKGFAVASGDGNISLYHTTAERHLLSESADSAALSQLVYAPRGNALLAQDGAGQLQLWYVDNEHPEISLSSLWGEVWYESYPEPEYIWQSSAADQDFEPKFSLMPLTFGTLKAAFYAMLFAMPLAICGAIYTAYFMSPGMRKVVKPTIEIMEALPTVILGFLAGLWLAPFVEANLAGVFSVLLILPIGMVAFGFAWSLVPATVARRFHEGWFAALLIPVVIVLSWLAIAAGPGIESALFGGDMRHWVGENLGLTFDQRNSLVVGIAMGFAVIPTIFSITEDAIFSVPKHLTLGSLALGATTWQTLTRVVILTASPGMFSAVMIGLGRAVGETMIVLMATGNTPIMDFNIFEGMRTLSANIAVEMPESEVGSSHYRILFLAALVLFIVTFAFNTFAELVRQRLRNKYASL